MIIITTCRILLGVRCGGSCATRSAPGGGRSTPRALHVSCACPGPRPPGRGEAGKRASGLEAGKRARNAVRAEGGEPAVPAGHKRPSSDKQSPPSLLSPSADRRCCARGPSLPRMVVVARAAEPRGCGCARPSPSARARAPRSPAAGRNSVISRSPLSRPETEEAGTATWARRRRAAA